MGHPGRWVKTMKKIITLLLAALLCQGCNDSQDDVESRNDVESTSAGGVIQVGSDDTDMNTAMRQARDSFGQFWAEVSADYERVIPALSNSMVKAYFADNPEMEGGEHLWITGVNYDGSKISGTVASAPLHLSAPKLGDQVTFPLERLSDWLIVDDGKAKGAYTVQLLRSKMTKAERAQHDAGYPFAFAPIK